METAKRTLAQIEAEIAETKAALNNVHGTETEVYARIVGYYRAVRNWNKGKREEYDHRKMFVFNDEEQYSITAADSVSCDCKVENVTEEAKASVNTIASNTTSGTTAASYEMFTRATCPNCPPVKQYMANVSIAGKSIDVDTDAGLQLAASKGVFATPTVIIYDNNGMEIGRAHDVSELNAILVPAKETVLA